MPTSLAAICGAPSAIDGEVRAHVVPAAEARVCGTRAGGSACVAQVLGGVYLLVYGGVCEEKGLVRIGGLVV